MKHRLSGRAANWWAQIKKAIPVCFAAIGMTCTSTSAVAADLVDLRATQIGDDGARIVITLSAPVVRPTSFALQSPPRLSVDLDGVANRLSPSSQALNAGVVSQVNSAEVAGRTRLVFTLSRPVPYDMQVVGNEVVLLLNAGAAPGGYQQLPAAPPPFVPGQASPALNANISTALAVAAVDFRLGEEGAGQVSVSFSKSGAQPAIKRQQGDLIVNLPGVSVPNQFSKNYDVRDFATVVDDFDVQQIGGDARLTIRTAAEYEFNSYQTASSMVLELTKLEKQAEEGEPAYRGEPVSLNVQDIQVRELLSLLAETADVNIIASDTVEGDVTLRLKDVPWDQALDLILTTKGLEKRVVGNVIYVAPLEEIGSYEQRQREIILKNEELAPLESEIIQINYAKASDLAVVLEDLKERAGPGSGGPDSNNQEDRRRIAVDQRTNTLLIYDTREQLENAKQLVAQLDRPIPQVLIESRVVIANDDFSKELGVRFGGTFFDADSDGAVAITGSSVGASELLDDFTTDGFPVEAPLLGDRLGVSLPVSNPAGRIGFGILGPDFLIDLELSALQAEGTGQVVSAPRVITSDQHEARIEQGVEIPYLNTTGDGGATIEFRKAVLSLSVTPQITPDSRIIMDLEVNKDNVGQEVSSGLTGGRIPTIDTRQVTTQVLVNDGDTVVLGGIYETTQINSQTKVPLLGDIPLLGYLFRSNRDTDNKVELLIFVTPKVVREELSVGGY